MIKKILAGRAGAGPPAGEQSALSGQARRPGKPAASEDGGRPQDEAPGRQQTGVFLPTDLYFIGLLLPEGLPGARV